MGRKDFNLINRITHKIILLNKKFSRQIFSRLYDAADAIKIGGSAGALCVWKELEVIVDITAVERATSCSSAARIRVAAFRLVIPEAFVRVTG